MKKGTTTINSVAPGVFFYWIKVTAVQGANEFTVTQSITTGNFDSHFFGQAAGSFLYNSSCVKQATTQPITTVGGVTTIMFNAASAGTYIIGIKYDTGSVKGFTEPTGGSATYEFSTSNTPNSTDSPTLVRKP